MAGGTGSRLWPSTKVISKQLLPVYDKPMIYYPLTTLMLAGVREILVITTPQDQNSFADLLGDGSQFGVSIQYAVQPKPEGLAQAFIIAEDFVGDSSCLMILGDNIFHGSGLGHQLRHTLPNSGAHIFTYVVADPSQYGVLSLNIDGDPISIIEKPKNSISRLAVTGLYFFDNRVAQIAKQVVPSPRGELEITSILDVYLKKKELTITQLTRGTAWLDTGNPKFLHDAATYVRVIEERTGMKIACPEEIAWRNEWLTDLELANRSKTLGNNEYSNYLKDLIGSVQNF